MRIDQLLDVELLAHHINEGNVSERRHPSDSMLRIYNYTNQCQYDQAWDDVTQQCRGLIVDHGRLGGEIVARPFPKFFHPDEPLAPKTEGLPDRVTAKRDGSLGICYTSRHSDLPQVATRGSFTSEQATFATQWLEERLPNWTPPDGVTVLWEIIYPENRIVVDYGDWAGLVLLEGIEIETGRSLDPNDIEWPGEKVRYYQSFELDALYKQINMMDNFEGFVCFWESEQARKKLKSDRYMELHRIVTGLNARTIWEVLRSEDDIDEFIAQLPDEFQEWSHSIADHLKAGHNEICQAAAKAYDSVMQRTGLPVTDPGFRKAFAQTALNDRQQAPITVHPHLLFSMLDGRSIDDMVWKLVKPDADLVP